MTRYTSIPIEHSYARRKPADRTDSPWSDLDAPMTTTALQWNRWRRSSRNPTAEVTSGHRPRTRWAYFRRPATITFAVFYHHRFWHHVVRSTRNTLTHLVKAAPRRSTLADTNQYTPRQANSSSTSPTSEPEPTHAYLTIYVHIFIICNRICLRYKSRPSELRY